MPEYKRSTKYPSRVQEVTLSERLYLTLINVEIESNLLDPDREKLKIGVQEIIVNKRANFAMELCVFGK